MSQAAQLLTFRIESRWYACDLLWTREILRRPALTPVHGAPPLVRGLVHLRGQILTALDLHCRLGLEPPSAPPLERCVVFKTAAELARLAHPPADADQAGSDLVGILADEIGDILPRPERVLPPPPETMSRLRQDCLAGVLPRADGLLTLLKTGALLGAVTTP